MINKICTSIEQSKKLAAGILPPESADGHYKVNRYNNESKIFMIPYSELGYYKDNDYQYSVCAWSLAALRACLPPGISIDGILYVFESHKTFDNEWVYEYKFEDISVPFYSKSSNEIDAAVEMILKLHERKLL